MLRRRHRNGGLWLPHAYPLVDDSARDLRRFAVRLALIVMLLAAIGGSVLHLARRDHQVEVERAYRQGIQEGLQGAQSCRAASV